MCVFVTHWCQMNNKMCENGLCIFNQKLRKKINKEERRKKTKQYNY